MAELARLGGETMGTSWSVQFPDVATRDLRALHDTIAHALQRVVGQMSTWEPSSEISRFNKAKSGSWVQISLEFMTVLQCAQQIAVATDGAFDPTVGSLVGLWGFGANASSDPPSMEQVDEARRACGFAKLRLDPTSLTVYQPGGMYLDLSAIAKGFSADLVAMRLAENGVESALVEVGGELFANGHSPRGAGWNVLVETGADEDELLEPRVVSLYGNAIATSGDRWFHYEHNDSRISHSIDPRSGMPISDDLASVTVIADSAMRADAWATALSVMGVDEGLKFAQSHSLAARFVERERGSAREHLSAEFVRYLVA